MYPGVHTRTPTPDAGRPTDRVDATDRPSRVESSRVESSRRLESRLSQHDDHQGHGRRDIDDDDDDDDDARGGARANRAFALDVERDGENPEEREERKEG